MPEISAIICTYNRASMLVGAIESLAAQTLSRKRYEVLVVDNNSTDDTADAVASIQRQYPNLSLVYLREKRQGLGYARNAGWRAARARIVGFIDDDARANPEWLEKALSVFQNTDPVPFALGGAITPFYDSSRPSWFKDEYEERGWGNQRRYLRHGESFSGSNLVLWKEALERFGGFAETAGMTGNRLSVGEETALFMNIWGSGEGEDRILYLPDLVVTHHVPTWKMTVGYRCQRAYAEGQNDFRLRVSSGAVGSFRYRLWALRTILVGMGRAMARIRKYSCRENWLVEAMRPVWSGMGSLGIGRAFRSGSKG